VEEKLKKGLRPSKFFVEEEKTISSVETFDEHWDSNGGAFTGRHGPWSHHGKKADDGFKGQRLIAAERRGDPAGGPPGEVEAESVCGER